MSDTQQYNSIRRRQLPHCRVTKYSRTSLTGPQQPGCSDYLALRSLHIPFDAQSYTRLGVTTQRCRNIDRLVDIAGKETTVLIIVHCGRYLRDDSHIQVFHLFGHGLVLL